MKISVSSLLLAILLASLLLGGCGAVPKLSTPTETPVPPTSTPVPSATATSTPTHTPTSAPKDTPTPLPSPTENHGARSGAKKTAVASEANAKAAPDLEKYGIDPAAGRVIWSDTKPYKLQISNYLENKNQWIHEVGSLTDFVIQSDVTWETSGALSLCGFTFHAEDDLEMGAQNRLFIMRLQFAPGWTIWRWEYGQFQSFVNGSWRSTADIHDENGSSNLLALVVQGKTIDVYINHDKQFTAEDSVLKEGQLALSAFQDSGKTKCTFEDTWVWTPDK